MISMSDYGYEQILSSRRWDFRTNSDILENIEQLHVISNCHPCIRFGCHIYLSYSRRNLTHLINIESSRWKNLLRMSNKLSNSK